MYLVAESIETNYRNDTTLFVFELEYFPFEEEAVEWIFSNYGRFSELLVQARANEICYITVAVLDSDLATEIRTRWEMK